MKSLRGKDSGIVNTDSGETAKVFTFNQNRCSRSARMSVHVGTEYADGDNVIDSTETYAYTDTPVNWNNILND